MKKSLIGVVWTHIVAIPIESSSVLAKQLVQVQEDVIARKRGLNGCRMRRDRFHLPLSRLQLDYDVDDDNDVIEGGNFENGNDNEDYHRSHVQRVKNVVQKFARNWRELKHSSAQGFALQGLEIVNNREIYCRLAENDHYKRLSEWAMELRENLHDHGLAQDPTFQDFLGIPLFRIARATEDLDQMGIERPLPKFSRYHALPPLRDQDTPKRILPSLIDDFLEIPNLNEMKIHYLDLCKLPEYGAEARPPPGYFELESRETLEVLKAALPPKKKQQGGEILDVIHQHQQEKTATIGTTTVIAKKLNNDSSSSSNNNNNKQHQPTKPTKPTKSVKPIK